MAFVTADLALISHVNGYNLFRYDSTDPPDTIDDGGYFNNTDDDQKLVVGDQIMSISWTTAVRTGTINLVKYFIVTAVVSGRVNISEILGDSAGTVSSGDV